MTRLLTCAAVAMMAQTGVAAGPPSALSPAEERATFRVGDGFQVSLVASEPDVVDPVAMCFDEKGRLYVCEMRGYPNGGVGTGNETRGRIRCLTDTDGDGVFDTAHTFAEGLRFPMGIQPWKGGLLVAVAPDILYLEDTDGDGKADRTTVLYTGFNLANIQQMVNGLQWGLDNWVYGCAGNDGGIVKSGEKPNAPEVSLRNRGLRFQPWRVASLEPTSGGGQYGLTADDYQHWFTATNSQHLRQIVLPEPYLRRNPYLAVSAVTLDIPEHGAAARVFRTSPFEPWRVERTTRRAGGPDAKKFPTTELVPGGYITSACSPLIYTADLFPGAYRGNNFVCDPANNLIHREVLVGKGAVFSARRVDVDTEFLTSTDNWFRPVHLSIGPDGAIYVLDFYREVIETPISLPEDIKRKLNLESRGRGRIWRVAPTEFKPARMPDLSRMSPAQLADELLSPNSWHRLTAQRLLIERQPKEAVAAIRERLPQAVGKGGRANLLWALHGLGGLTPADLLLAFDDPQPGIREQGLRLAEEFFATTPELRNRAARLTGDTDPHVRFQLALSAGVLPPDEAGKVLAALLAQDAADPWTQTAVLSSSAECCFPLLEFLLRDKAPPVPLLVKLAAMIGAKGDDVETTRLLTRIADGATSPEASAALLDGAGQGMRNGKKPLATWWTNPPAGSEGIVRKLRGRFEAAARTTVDTAASSRDRVGAASLLAMGPFDLAAPALTGVLTPSTSGDLQLAAVRSLAAQTDPKVADLLLKPWAGYAPALRREVLEAMVARPDRALVLLEAIEKQIVSAYELDPARAQSLKAHPSAAVRSKAAAVLKATVNADRAKVVAAYAPALDLKGDAMKGRAVFRAQCTACHKLDGFGHDVGANLLAALPNKSGEDILVAVFDPNREVDPRYVNYQATTVDGRSLSGIIATETPTSVTLRRADGAEETILRANLDTLRSTRLSLMPEGLEKLLSHQNTADLLAYLRTAGR